MPNIRDAPTLLIKQAGPTMLASLTNTAIQCVIARWFGQLGRAELAASGPISTASSLYASSNGVVFALSIVVARVNRETEPQAVGEYYQAALVLSTSIAIALTPLAYEMGGVFAALGQSEAVATAINDYFRALVQSGGLIPLLNITALRRFSVGLQKSTLAMAITLSNAGLSTLLSYAAAIYYRTARGFGYAAAASQWLTFIGFMLYFACHPDFKPYQLWNRTGFRHRQRYWEICTVGLPMMINPLFECIAILILSGLIGRSGPVAAAFYAIANQYARVGIMMANTLAATIGTLMTSTLRNSAGANPAYPLYRWLGLGLGLGTACCSVPLLLGSTIAPQPLIQLFQTEAVTESTASAVLTAVAVGNAFDVVRIVSNGASRPFPNRNTCNLLINLLSIALGTALAGLSCALGLGGAVGMVIGFYAGVALAAILQTRDVYQSIAQTATAFLPQHAAPTEHTALLLSR